MGLSFSTSIETSENSFSTNESNHSTSTPWIPKPLQNCDHNDLIRMMREFDFVNPMLEKIFKEKTVHGYIFVDMAKAINSGDEVTIRKEREYLIESLSQKYNVDKGIIHGFVTGVIEAKIMRDKEESSAQTVRPFAEIEKKYNPQYQFDSSVPVLTTETSQLDQFSQNELIKLNGTIEESFNIGTTFTDAQINDWERQGIIAFKQKLIPYFKQLEEKKRNKLGFSGDLELDSQNNVCKDRFMYKTFTLPILSNPKRRNTGNRAFIAVKLVISDLGGNNFSKMVRKNILSRSVDTEFGILHTGLIIGEWKLDWYNNSIVSVRSKESIEASNSIAVIDLGFIRDQEKIKQAFLSISDICCTFNAKKTYGQFDCNCQHFVTQILDALSLSKPTGGAFDKYFADLKKGVTTRKYYYTDSLISLIKRQGDNVVTPNSSFRNSDMIEFTQRSTIDQFCRWLNDLKYFDTEEGETDYKLLKAFDRSFCIARNDEGDKIIDYSSSSGLKDNSFFSLSGRKDDNSIRRIEYNVANMILPIPNRN